MDAFLPIWIGFYITFICYFPFCSGKGPSGELYTSKFKITYVNANGQTTGDAFTLDLAGKDTLVPLDPESINIYDKVIEFSSSATTNYQNLKYVISDINKGCVAKKGDVDLLNDNTIDISTLPKSLYSISLYNDNNEKVGNLKWIKHWVS